MFVASPFCRGWFNDCCRDQLPFNNEDEGSVVDKRPASAIQSSELSRLILCIAEYASKSLTHRPVRSCGHPTTVSLLQELIPTLGIAVSLRTMTMAETPLDQLLQDYDEQQYVQSRREVLQASNNSNLQRLPRVASEPVKKMTVAAPRNHATQNAGWPGIDSGDRRWKEELEAIEDAREEWALVNASLLSSLDISNRRLSSAQIDSLAAIRSAVNIAASSSEEEFKACRCVPDSTACRDCLKAARRCYVLRYLEQQGFDAAICHTQWDHSKGVPAGEHTFIEVLQSPTTPGAADGQSQAHSRVIVDLDFREQFAMVHPVDEYQALWLSLPERLVAPEETLQRLLVPVLAGMRLCAFQQEMSLPPWRRSKFIRSKWFGSALRVSARSQQHLPCAALLCPLHRSAAGKEWPKDAARITPKHAGDSEPASPFASTGTRSASSAAGSGSASAALVAGHMVQLQAASHGCCCSGRTPHSDPRHPSAQVWPENWTPCSACSSSHSADARRAGRVLLGAIEKGIQEARGSERQALVDAALLTMLVTSVTRDLPPVKTAFNSLPAASSNDFLFAQPVVARRRPHQRSALTLLVRADSVPVV